MARKNRLTRIAVKIGTAVGRADRKAHQIAKAGVLAKKELVDISRQVDALKRQLQKTTKRLMRALSSQPTGSPDSPVGFLASAKSSQSIRAFPRRTPRKIK